MIRKIIGKIVDTILPPANSEEAGKTPDGTPAPKIKTISLEELLGGAGAPPPEPELRVIGLYSSVEDEKIAELTQALLYLNETNKMRDKEKEKTKALEKGKVSGKKKRKWCTLARTD